MSLNDKTPADLSVNRGLPAGGEWPLTLA